MNNSPYQKMNNLYADLDIKLIVESHPYTSDICNINKKYKSLCEDPTVLNMLRNKWLFPGQQIPKDYPTLTYKDIKEYSLFYYPIPESIGKFHPISLYYRASIVYDEQDCEYFLNAAINSIFQKGFLYSSELVTCCIIANAANHLQLLNKLYNKFITKLHYQGETELARKELCVLCVSEIWMHLNVH